MTPEYRNLLDACRACTLAELHTLLMRDLRVIRQEKAQEARRDDWESEEDEK